MIDRFSDNTAANRRLGLEFLATMIAIQSLPFIISCEQGYDRGDCEPGYLDVDGVCQPAVGQACQGGGDCLSDICVRTENGENFCSIDCDVHEDCPASYFCNSEVDGRCHPGRRPQPCEDKSDCGPCEQCSNRFCLLVPECVPCGLDEQCGSCQRCDQHECIEVAGCVRCTESSQCPPCKDCSEKGECQLRTGCIQCGSEPDCPACQTCRRMACEPIPGCGQDPCLDDLDCPSRTRCLYDWILLQRTCLQTDLPFGSDCSHGRESSCAEGMCVDDFEGNLACSRSCQKDLECTMPTKCLPDPDCDWACRKTSPSPPGDACLSDRDCPPDRICGLIPDSKGTAWQTRCQKPVFCAKPTGSSCDQLASDRCSSGICTQSGFCSAVCAGDRDCPRGMLCTPIDLPLPSGGYTAPFYGCAPQSSTQAEIGEACSGGNADCQSNLCVEESPGFSHPYCSTSCVPGGIDCPDRFECAPSPLDPGSDLCLPSSVGGLCLKSPDCPEEQVCTLDRSLGTTVCVDADPNGSAPGESCVSGGLCQNSLCLPQGVCGAICTDSQDCPVNLVCDVTDFWLIDGSMIYARICTLPLGSLTACRTDKECPESEVCGLQPNLRLSSLDGVCTTPGWGGPSGSECTRAAQCVNGFCPSTGRCSTLCIDAADCPPEARCDDSEVSLGPNKSFPIKICVETSPGELGNACPNGALDCLSGICFVPSSGTAYCSTTCTDPDDCAPEVSGMQCIDDGRGVSYCRLP